MCVSDWHLYFNKQPKDVWGFPNPQNWDPGKPKMCFARVHDTNCGTLYSRLSPSWILMSALKQILILEKRSAELLWTVPEWLYQCYRIQTTEPIFSFPYHLCYPKFQVCKLPKRDGWGRPGIFSGSKLTSASWNVALALWFMSVRSTRSSSLRQLRHRVKLSPSGD